jgi:hypothetical protein
MAGWKIVATLALAACLAAPAATAADDDGWIWLFKSEEDLGKWNDGGKPWLVEDGVLTWQKGCGYIWTKETYGDFVLDLEVKVSKGCNSGIFIRSDPKNAVQGGIEVQVLDSYGKTPNKHTFGAVYDALTPSKEASKAPGEWNHVTITCNDNKIEVVVNGEQIIDMDLEKWTEGNKNPDGSKNKFKKPLKDFAREGHIGFQDHGKPVWYRNVRVKPLETK